MSVQVGLGKQFLLAIILIFIILVVVEGISQVLFLQLQEKCGMKSKYYDNYDEELISQLCDDYKNFKYVDSAIRTNLPNQMTSSYSVNEYGFRGSSMDMEKPNDEYRIMMVGGSTTFGLGSTSNEHTIPSYLESILTEKFRKNIKVINAGVIAASSSSEVYYIQNYLVKFNPDLIIVLDGYNDSFNIKLDEINPNDKFVSNLNLSPSELFFKDVIKIFATPNLIFHYTHDYYQIQYLTDEIKTLNTQKWVDRWNKTCNFAHENNFELFVGVQPMLGTSDRLLSENESNLKKSNIQHSKTIELLNDLANNIDSISCPHADLRNTFDGIDEQVYYSLVHTGDKQNEIIAHEISKNISSIIEKQI